MRAQHWLAIVLLALAACAFVAALVRVAAKRDLSGVLLALAGLVAIVGIRHALGSAEASQ